jgi:PAS domain-containing protein
VAEPIELILLRQWASYLALPVWVVDATGALIYYNESAEPILGRRFEEAGPMSVDELSSIFVTTDETGAPLESADLPIAVAFLEQRPAHRRLRIRGLDGRWRLIEVTAFPVVGQAGRALGAVSMFWEVDGG